jgi:hypothetical protein
VNLKSLTSEVKVADVQGSVEHMQPPGPILSNKVNEQLHFGRYLTKNFIRMF